MTPAEYREAALKAAAEYRAKQQRGESTEPTKPQVVSDRAARMLRKAAKKASK